MCIWFLTKQCFYFGQGRAGTSRTGPGLKGDRKAMIVGGLVRKSATDIAKLIFFMICLFIAKQNKNRTHTTSLTKCILSLYDETKKMYVGKTLQVHRLKKKFVQQA